MTLSLLCQAFPSLSSAVDIDRGEEETALDQLYSLNLVHGILSSNNIVSKIKGADASRE